MPKATKQKNVSKTSKQTTLLSWLFVPNLKEIGIGKWAFRALLFLLASYFFILIFGTIGLQQQLSQGAQVIPSFHATMSILISATLQRPIEMVIVSLVSYIIGLIAFFPRKYLDKTSFIAAFWTMTVWFSLFAVGLWATNKFLGSEFRLVFFAFILLAVYSLLAIFSTVVCYARYYGVKKLAILLSFPLGISFYEYAGFFLPSTTKENVISIKYNWYKKAIEFLTDKKSGQIALALISIFVLAVNPTPWGMFTAAFFVTLYWLRGKTWMIEKLPRLGWIIGAANCLTILSVVCFVILR